MRTEEEKLEVAEEEAIGFLDKIYGKGLERVKNVEIAIEQGIEVTDDIITCERKLVKDDLMGFFGRMVEGGENGDKELAAYFREQIEQLRHFEENPEACKGILKDQFTKISELETTLNYVRQEHWNDIQAMRRTLLLAQGRIDELEGMRAFLPDE